ncbi:CHASE2 domain-containing protein [Pseudomonas sp. R3.Fl]|uniref:CHASE2 domain-containing protein n=1 Tax=Pseudomonas TaxID=286 RepID=UPI00201D5D68|nr:MULTISPECIES: CHASE2 domain-containing protein [Pseudomonas]MCL6688203.1 CHASE2 domain-containing protein [Pseudomonas sp. R3.Fl]UUC48521.1 CHASE2 domain-containing protein [Pseudomonas citronellolis]
MCREARLQQSVKAFVSRYARPIVFGLAVAFIALCDPFGLASSSNAASARWLNRLFAERYPDSGQHQVVVVLVDDAYLQRHQAYWPLPYNEQSKLFKRLLAYQPGAVFVDLLYSHDHSRAVPGQQPLMESQLLANVFERYQRQGIPLLLANTGLPRGVDGAVNALPRFASVSRPALVAWSGFGDQYPLAAPTPLGTLETPALGLYREYCRRHDCPTLPADAEAAAQLPAMALQWGLKLSPQQEHISTIGHCSAPGVFRQMLQAMFWKLGNSAQATCPYSLTLTASDLEATADQDRALLRELLRGKLVLVGASIAGTGDLTLSPLHGKIPGVYLHAMALDNLIAWGPHYYRDPPALADFSLGSVNLLDLAQLALLGLIAQLKFLQARPAGRWPHSPWLRSPMTGLALMTLLLAALSYALYRLNMTPVNVLGILLLSLSLFTEKIQERLQRNA